MHNAKEPFWGKTLRIIREIWPLGAPDELQNRLSEDLEKSEIGLLKDFIDDCLSGRGGEVWSRGKAAELGRAYLQLNKAGQERFLELLAYEFGVDNPLVDEAIEHRKNCETPEEMELANQKLRQLLEPPRAKLLSQFNELQDGVKFLVIHGFVVLPGFGDQHHLTVICRSCWQLGSMSAFWTCGE